MKSLMTTLLALLLAACGGGTDSVSPLPVARQFDVVVVSGAAQRGSVATELVAPVVVRAIDAETAAPRAGIVVNWVPDAGGSVFAPATATDNAGYATQYWTLGTVSGEQWLEARAVDPITGQKIVYARIAATAEPGPPASLQITGPDYLYWSGLSFGAFGTAAFDAYGNGIPYGTGCYTGEIAWRFGDYLKFVTPIDHAIFNGPGGATWYVPWLTTSPEIGMAQETTTTTWVQAWAIGCDLPPTVQRAVYLRP